MTNANLKGYKAGGNIQISRGIKLKRYREIISRSKSCIAATVGDVLT